MSRLPILLLLTVVSAPSIAPAGERYDFTLHCAGCHKPDGSGSEIVPGLDETGELFALPGGREYLASVPGAAQAPLSDERLAALLNWMLGEFGGTVPTRPYGGAEVGALRAHPLRDPIAARTHLLHQASPHSDNSATR